MEWISIKERMPNDGEKVLLYTPYEVFGDDHTWVGNREGIQKSRMNINGKMAAIFTHWMPLPDESLGQLIGYPTTQH